MSLLSHETETALKMDLLATVENYLEARGKIPQKVTGLVSANELKDELGVKLATLKRWEGAGLKKYQPPLEDSRKAYYRVTDVLKFLGVENGKN